MTDPVRPQLFRIYTDYDTEEIFDMPQQLLSISGMGMPSVSNLTVATPYQHGETFLGFVVRPRLLQIAFHLSDLWGARAWDGYGTRQRLINILNPTVAPFYFELVMNNGDLYTLEKVYFEAGFEAGLPQSQGNSNKQGVAVRLRCGWPFWLGEDYTLTSSLAAGAQTFACETYGNFYSWPEITLTGPLTLPIVYLMRWDTATAAVAEVAHIGINATNAAGEHVYITTRPTEVAVIDDNGDTVALTADSTFCNFVLTPHPIRYLHDLQSNASWYNNFIRVTASAYGVGASVEVTHSDHWSGI